MQQINFHYSSLKNIDWENYSKDLKSLDVYSGNENLQNEIKNFVNSFCKGENLLFVNSGTAALELALMSLKLKISDEVIIPSYTFSSCANAVLRANATPVFCEIELETLHASINTIEPLINNNTKCIMIVEYAGIRANLLEIKALCEKNGIILILDSAQAFAAFDKDYDNSDLADFVCYSFHDTKNYSCGEGGLLVINNTSFLDVVHIMYEKGTNRLQFAKGIVDKYSWHDIGSSFILSNVNLLLLKYQLKIIDQISLQKSEAILVYNNYFKKKSFEFVICYSDHSRCSNGHIFWLILDSSDTRNSIINYFKNFNIQITTHYVPLHSSHFSKKSRLKHAVDLNVTNLAGNCLLRLPVITSKISKKIIDIFSNFELGKND